MNTTNITINTQRSIRIAGSKILYFDPFQIMAEPHDADIIFITHSHHDHLDPASVEKVARENTVFVAPSSMGQEMRKVVGDAELLLMMPGDAQYPLEISVEAVPAYNRLKPFHPKSSGWVGYLLKTGEETVYIAGDTDATVEAAQVRCDIAMVPIGGTFTMNAKQAAELINRIQPAVAIPTHYGSVVGSIDDAGVFAGNVDPSVSVEIKMP